MTTYEKSRMLYNWVILRVKQRVKQNTIFHNFTPLLPPRRENEKALKTSCFQGFSRYLVGGDKRDRTADLLNAIQNKIKYFQWFIAQKGETGVKQEHDFLRTFHIRNGQLHHPPSLRITELYALGFTTCSVLINSSIILHAFAGLQVATVCKKSLSP